VVCGRVTPPTYLLESCPWGRRGTGIFEDDTALDVRGHYRELVAGGATDAEATVGVLDRYGRDDVVWLALAVSASEVGRPDDDTRNRAVAIVDRVNDVSDERVAELARVRAQLLGPQPRRTQIRISKAPSCGLDPGDVLALECGTGWKLLRVAFVDDGKPTLQLLDFHGSSPPDATELLTISDCTTVMVRSRPWRCQALQPYDGWRDAGFELIGSCGRADPSASASRSTKWTAIADRLRALER
jgi:hypothetical protein